MFSVIIPALNEEKFLPKLLQSLSEQSRKDFEVIVVDGKSLDKTVAIAKSFIKKLPSLSVIISKKASLPLQRNLGAKEARGDWYVFVDADSILLPYFMERINNYIREYKPTVFSTWFSPDSNEPNDTLFILLSILYIETMKRLKKPLTPGPLTVVHKNAFELLGGYDEAHEYNEDVDLGLRLNKNGIEIMMLREVLYILSLRRVRKEGMLKLFNQYIVSIFPILFFNRPLKRMPGYIMGGQIYGKKKKLKQPMLKEFEKKLKALLKEFLE